MTPFGPHRVHSRLPLPAACRAARDVVQCASTYVRSEFQCGDHAVIFPKELQDGPLKKTAPTLASQELGRQKQNLLCQAGKAPEHEGIFGANYTMESGAGHGSSQACCGWRDIESLSGVNAARVLLFCSLCSGLGGAGPIPLRSLAPGTATLSLWKTLNRAGHGLRDHPSISSPPRGGSRGPQSPRVLGAFVGVTGPTSPPKTKSAAKSGSMRVHPKDSWNMGGESRRK